MTGSFRTHRGRPKPVVTWVENKIHLPVLVLVSKLWLGVCLFLVIMIVDVLAEEQLNRVIFYIISSLHI